MCWVAAKERDGLPYVVRDQEGVCFFFAFSCFLARGGGGGRRRGGGGLCARSRLLDVVGWGVVCNEVAE